LSPQVRALLIGLIGPLLQAAGVTWDLLDHGLFSPGGLEQVTFQHIVSGPAHLMMGVGLMLSVVCIPIVVQVAAARPEDLLADDRVREPEERVSPAEFGPAEAETAK